MPISLYNSLNRRIEPFSPLDPARVTMYTTVWGGEAAAVGIKNRSELVVYPLQSLHAQLS